MNGAREFKELLGLTSEPIAISFQSSTPKGVPRVTAPAISGCEYWKLAAKGYRFHTTPEDHGNCPIGAVTHGVTLSAEQRQQLEEMLSLMTSLSYLKPEEVNHIPSLDKPFKFAVYLPISEAEETSDVILIRGTPRQIMLLIEAANACNGFASDPVMGRPTCALIPIVLRSGKCATNFGCIGNRVYTKLSDDEMYFAAPGLLFSQLLIHLRTIVAANRRLEAFHADRASQRDASNRLVLAG